MKAGAAALVLVLAGCGGKGAEVPVVDTARVVAPTPLADSLALRTPDGVEVWFTGSRSAQSVSGERCVERVMEIRDGNRRVAIPLLYTGSVPRLVNRSTIEAPIWLNCRPGNVYQVDLRTGQPVRVK